MRMVTITLTYDMDDDDKSLQDELRDWIAGNVAVIDLMEQGDDEFKATEGCSVTITENKS